MTQRALCPFLGACTFLAGASFASFGLAQAPLGAKQSAAEELFEDARRDLRAGRTADACPKLEESQRLDPGVGTLLHLGECYERLGRTASAWAAFRDVEPLARARGDHDRARLAGERAEALAPRLARLVIDVPLAARVPGLRVELDGVAVGAASWGLALPADPGARAVRVAVPDQPERTFVVTTEPAKTIRWILPSPVNTSSGQGLPGPVSAAPRDVPPPTSPPSHPRTVVIAGAATSGVLLAAGGFFGLRALSDWRSSRASCDADNACDPPGLAAIDRAQTSATVATTLLATGAVVGAATLVLSLRAPQKPHVALGPRGVSVAIGWR